MNEIQRTLENGVEINGTCHDAFLPVLDAFIENFNGGQEVGASVALTQKGKSVVDLWGGFADRRKNRPWEEDTVSTVFSCTKGAVALCAHVLVSRGLLDLDAPVTEYWPEFAGHGRDPILVSMLLDHSAGLPVFQEKVKKGGYYDWDYMVDLVLRTKPTFEAGTRLSYHAMTYGWLVGELIRQVLGKSLGTFFREEIAEPLGIDFWIGFPEDQDHRSAEIIPNRPNAKGPLTLFLETALNDPESIAGQFSFNTGGASARHPEYRRAELGGAGGVTNARGLAGMYAPLACGGRLGDIELVDKQILSRMSRVSMATRLDATLLIPTRFALGFVKSMDNRNVTRLPGVDSLIMSDAAFGHAGMGGSVGFADPVEGLSFGYTMNFMGHGNLVNERGQDLIDAAYRSLGYADNSSGVWMR